jgi:hypothetical protein
MQDKPLPENKKVSAKLTKKIASLSNAKTRSAKAAAMLKKISGKRIEVAPNEMGIVALNISFKNSDARIQIDRGNATYEIIAGRDHWKYNSTQLNTLAGPPRSKQGAVNQVASRYSWTNANTLELRSRFVEESIRGETWILRFEENGSEIKAHIETKVFVEFMGINSRMLEGKIVR